MGPIGCPETSATDYQSTLRKTPEERRSHIHRGGSLKSRIAEEVFDFQGRLLRGFASPLPLTSAFIKNHIAFSCWKPVTCAVDTETEVACLQNTTSNIAADSATGFRRRAGTRAITRGPVPGVPQGDTDTPCHHFVRQHCSPAESSARDTLRHTDA